MALTCMSLIDALADVARVIAFDYEGHILAGPMPETLTPDNVVADFLAIANAAGRPPLPATTTPGSP